MPVAAIGLGLAAVGAIEQGVSAVNANKKLKELGAQDPAYAANPLAAQRLGLAQTLLNARMPGAVSAERNIQANTAATNNAVEKNATSGAGAIAAESQNQGRANQAVEQLGQQEAQDYQRRFQNYGGAVEGAISEGDKVMQDRIRRFQDQAQIQGAVTANTRNAWGSLTNLGLGVANYGMAMGKSHTGIPPVDPTVMYNNSQWMQSPPYMFNNYLNQV